MDDEVSVSPLLDDALSNVILSGAAVEPEHRFELWVRRSLAAGGWSDLSQLGARGWTIVVVARVGHDERIVGVAGKALTGADVLWGHHGVEMVRLASMWRRKCVEQRRQGGASPAAASLSRARCCCAQVGAGAVVPGRR